MADPQDFDLWLAQWGSEPPTAYSFGMWQRTANGWVNGVNTHVDMDIAYKNYAAIIKSAGMNGYKGASLLENEPTKAAQTTVGELQQTTVEAMKAAAANGKLDEDQIAMLQTDLLRMTKAKLAEPTVALLEAVKLDINALIQGAAEDLIGQMHAQPQLITGELGTE